MPNELAAPDPPDPNADLRAVDEGVLGVRRDHLALRYANGDVLVLPWDPRKRTWGICLAAYRWDGKNLHLVIGRLVDSKLEQVVRQWVAQSLAG